jgi:hypothetical protein
MNTFTTTGAALLATVGLFSFMVFCVVDMIQSFPSASIAT